MVRDSVRVRDRVSVRVRISVTISVRIRAMVRVRVRRARVGDRPAGELGQLNGHRIRFRVRSVS